MALLSRDVTFAPKDYEVTLAFAASRGLILENWFSSVSLYATSC